MTFGDGSQSTSVTIVKKLKQIPSFCHYYVFFGRAQKEMRTSQVDEQQVRASLYDQRTKPPHPNHRPKAPVRMRPRTLTRGNQLALQQLGGASAAATATLHFRTRVLFELPRLSHSATAEKTTSAFRLAAWRAAKCAIAADDAGGVVRVVDLSPAAADDTLTENKKQQHATIELESRAACLAFSRCGEFLAVADAAGTLHLFRASGELLFAYPVIAAGGDCDDSIVSLAFATAAAGAATAAAQDLVVVTASGAVLRLGELDLPSIEQILQRDRVNGLQEIVQSIRVQTASVGSLRAKQRSLLLVGSWVRACRKAGANAHFCAIVP